MGSNAKYKTDYLVTLPYIAVKYGKLTNAIAAKELKVSERTIIRWRKGHDEFNNAMADPLGSDLGKNYERVIGNMLHGRTVTERDHEGNITKEITHSPTHQDLMLPKQMGYMITDRYAKNQVQEELKKERKAMRHWIDKYNNSEINLSQLLTEYYNAAIEPPQHLVKEHANALATGTLEIVAEEDTYDQAHAAKILAAKREREEARIQRAIEEGIKEKLAELEQHQSDEN
jgi:hypothetical protein